MIPRALLVTAAALALAACGQKEDGRLQGYAEADYLYLAPREAGFVKTLAVREGEEVAAGALVFELDEKRAAATLSRARAQAAASGQGAAASAQQIAEARAQVVLARANLERTRALHQKGYVAKARLDTDQAALDAAVARLRSVEAQRRAASAETAAAGAEVALAREQAGDRRVTAPAAGRVEKIYRRPGEFVQAGDPVVSFLPPANMKLRFFAPEPMLSRLALGQVVDVACDNCAKGLRARISFIASEPQFTPPVIYSIEQRAKLVYLVEARPEAGARFRPGQPLDVTVAR